MFFSTLLELKLHYDGLGRRRVESRLVGVGSSPTLETVTLNYQGPNVVEEVDLSDEETVLYATTHGPAIDAPLLASVGCDMDPEEEDCVFAVGTDVRGDAVAAVPYEDDEVLEEVILGPWGERAVFVAGEPLCVEGREGTKGAALAVQTCGASVVLARFGLAGARVHPRTKIVDLRNRVYATHLRSFLTADPLGAVDSYGLFNYAAGDPINLRDPWGLDSGADGPRAGGVPGTGGGKSCHGGTICGGGGGNEDPDVWDNGRGNLVTAGGPAGTIWADDAGGGFWDRVVRGVEKFFSKLGSFVSGIFGAVFGGGNSGGGIGPRREVDELIDALDLGVDPRGSPTAMVIIEQAARYGVQVEEVAPQALGAKVSAVYVEERKVVKVPPKEGMSTFSRIARIIHELTHAVQAARRGTSDDLIAGGIDRKGFVKERIQREVEAEAIARKAGRELVEGREELEDEMTPVDRRHFDMGGQPMPSIVGGVYGDLYFYDGTPTAKGKFYESRYGRKYDEKTGGQ